MRPKIRDWLLLIGSLALTLLGAWVLLTGKGAGPGTAALLFFGACTGVAIKLIRDKLRAGDPEAARVLLERLRAGESLAPPRKHRFIAAGVIIALGLALLVTGSALGPEFMAASAALVIGGTGLLLALVLGWQAGSAFRFTRDGVRMATAASSYVVPWTAFERVQLGEMSGNPVVRLHIADLAAVVATLEVRRGDLAAQRAKLERSFAWSLRLGGCHLMFIPAGFGVDPVALFQAFVRYLDDPAARAELPAV